jgi:hypothetical protein
MNATNETSASKLTRESVQAVADLTKKVVDTQLRLTQEYAEAARTVLSGDADRVAAGRTFVESVQREAETYLSRITELSVAFGSGVLDLGDQVTRTVLDEVTTAAAHKETTEAPSAGQSAPASPPPDGS